ncbi:MAG: hypothetical protein IH830_04555 [Planctomycetes bacterium]|nr:hypothetical protein [Planctomycetota bacterium]
MRRQHRLEKWIARLGVFAGAWMIGLGSAQGQSMTWTTDTDFDEGTKVNVNHDGPNHDQLQLNQQVSSFPFINVAASSRGTVVRIDVNTGAILGEYRTAPVGRGRNPSRTTVDAFGNVWAGNRAEIGGGLGSVVKIGLVIGGTRVDAAGNPDPAGQYLAPPFDYNTCIDRDGDGLIKTSMGLGNILGWPDVTDGVGGATALVEDAEDECILIYQRVSGDFIRHVSVDGNNNVWTAGNFGGDNAFDLLDGNTGAVLASFDVGAGGYGGLVDGNGVLWSANRGPGPVTVLRYDTMGTITTADDTSSLLNAPNAYGLGIDSNGHVWNSQWTTNQIREYAPSGALLNIYGTGGANNDRGVAVTSIDDHIWVANSGGSDVSRLDNSGNLLKVIPLGADGVLPTGVAVDSNGKVWATCLSSNTAKRIDPNAGGDGLGAVDLTVNLGAGAGPYNYSDMTGTVLLTALQEGTWTVVWNSGTAGATSCTISWTSDEPAGTSVSVEARAADAVLDLPAELFVAVGNGVPIVGVAGQYWEIRATLGRDPGVDETPVMFDLTIQCEVPLDIKPGSCPNSFNRNSHGVLPVVLVGTDTFDPMDVDLSTVLLARADGFGGSVAPHEGPPGPHSVFDDAATPFDGQPCDCHELEGDGITDLKMKFKTDEVVPALQLNDLPAGDLVELILSGTLLDGTPFSGRDCIRLVPPGTPPGMLFVGSNLPGAWLDLSPLDLQLDGGGFVTSDGMFERTFPQTTVVTLTAAAVYHGWVFSGWLTDGGLYPGQSIDITIGGEQQRATAIYAPAGPAAIRIVP